MHISHSEAVDVALGHTMTMYARISNAGVGGVVHRCCAHVGHLLPLRGVKLGNGVGGMHDAWDMHSCSIPIKLYLSSALIVWAQMLLHVLTGGFILATGGKCFSATSQLLATCVVCTPLALCVLAWRRE